MTQPRDILQGELLRDLGPTNGPRVACVLESVVRDYADAMWGARSIDKREIFRDAYTRALEVWREAAAV